MKQKLLLLSTALLTSMVLWAYDFEIDGYRYTVITSSTAEFAGVNPNYEGEVIIPESVLYLGKQLSVNTIGEYAFQSYKSSFLRIPKHITIIKNAAFYNAQIDSLHFEDSDNPISLYNTINRTPSLCGSKLGSVYIGRQLNRCDYNSNADGPFVSSYVNKVFIGKTCSLGQELFQNCSNLEKVIVKDGSFIESISSECFRNCSRLKTVDLRKGLKSISSLAFYNCTSLDSIYIPSTVTSISSNAFSEAKNINIVVSASDAPVSIGETAFPGIVYLSATLYVPSGTKSKYETTNGWKEFANIIETNDLASDYYYYKFNLLVTTGGSVTIFNTSYSNQTLSTSIKEGDDVSFSINADKGFILKSLIVNGTDVTKDVNNNTYLISSINQDTSVEVTFTELTDTPAPAPNGDCATPTIIVSGNKMTFECETPDAEFTSYLTTSEEFTGGEVVIENKDITFTLTVYAIAPGYDRSKPATMKFTVKKSDVNGDGTVDVADIATIIGEMAARARMQEETEE